MIALDVKNTFNSTIWSKIMKEVEKRDISQYLVNLADSYFQERKIQISRSERMVERREINI